MAAAAMAAQEPLHSAQSHQKQSLDAETLQQQQQHQQPLHSAPPSDKAAGALPLPNLHADFDVTLTGTCLLTRAAMLICSTSAHVCAP